MSTSTLKNKKITSAYVHWFNGEDRSEKGRRITTLRNNDAKDFFITKRNAFVANGLNYVIGLFAYHGKKETKPVDHVYISNKNLVKNIGCSYGHATYVMNQLEDLFNLQVIYGLGRSRSRLVRISKQVLDFMECYTDEQLEDYIKFNKIADNQRFALKQVHRYLGWNIAPAQLSNKQKNLRKAFLSTEEKINYAHAAHTANQKDETRIQYIDAHKDQLSEQQQKQFENLKKAHEPGKKLEKYWWIIMIRFQQILTWLNRPKKNQEQETTTSVTNENLTEGETVAETAATAQQQRLPEASILLFIAQVILDWNERAERNNLPTVKRLTEGRYNSMVALMEEFNESEINQALHNIEYIHQGEEYDHKFTFERFMKHEDFLYALEYDKKSNLAVDVDVMDNIMTNINIRRMKYTVPSFKSIKEVNTWLSHQMQ